MEKENPKSKSEDQISVIQVVEKFLNLREKNIDFFKDFFCYLKLNTKQNVGWVSKYYVLIKFCKDEQ